MTGIRSFVVAAVVVGTAFLMGSAFAAELPVKSPVYKASHPAAISWSGFYVGATAGYGSGQASADLTPNAAAMAGPGIGAHHSARFLAARG